MLEYLILAMSGKLDATTMMARWLATTPRTEVIGLCASAATSTGLSESTPQTEATDGQKYGAGTAGPVRQGVQPPSLHTLKPRTTRRINSGVSCTMPSAGLD